MAYNLKIAITALKDIEDGMHWYNSCQDGLGDRFEEFVNKTLGRIQAYPLSASFTHDEVRYKLVDKFPYVILYELHETTVYVLRVFNTFRKPQ